MIRGMQLHHANSHGRFILRDDLSPEDAAMLQALYSRSGESVLSHLAKIDAGRREAVRAALAETLADSNAPDADAVAAIDAVLGQGASARAGSFMRSFYVGYNHKSIADCGSTVLFIEDVSLLAAKAIQDNPLYSGQETSTRYLDMGSRRVVDPVGTPASRAVIDRWMNFYGESRGAIAAEVRARHPRQPDEAEDVYERAVHARTFDILRGFLPAGVTTQLSWATNLRQAADKLATLRHHPAAEIAAVGEALTELVVQAYPSTAGADGAARVTGVVGDRDARAGWDLHVGRSASYVMPTRGPFLDSTILPGSLRDAGLDLLRDRPRGCVLPHFLSDLGQITWRFDLDFGSFRDIQRHRNGVCRMPLLSMEHGFHPWYLEQLPIERNAVARMLLEEQRQALDDMECGPIACQYYVPLGAMVPCQVTYCLPAAVYVVEVRSSKTVHPTLRAVAHRMAASLREALPDLKLHADMDPDGWTVRRGRQTISAR